jgi:hypothetical protein
MSALKDNDILGREIEPSEGFEYALRQPNATLFDKMLTECLENEEYAAAFKTKGPQDYPGSLFTALIFQQQKMISKLIQRIES